MYYYQEYFCLFPYHILLLKDMESPLFIVIVLISFSQYKQRTRAILETHGFNSISHSFL